jgi:hypothetical protein
VGERSNNADSQTYYTNDEIVKILGLVKLYIECCCCKPNYFNKGFKNYKSWPKVISRVLAMSLSVICGNIGYGNFKGDKSKDLL